MVITIPCSRGLEDVHSFGHHMTGILCLFSRGELTECLDVFDAICFRAQHDESSGRVQESGIWDISHHKRGWRIFYPDPLLTSSFYNLNLTNKDTMNMPNLGVNLSILGMALNDLTDQ